MPGFQFWFSGAALWLAGSFFITVVLGIIGVKEMIPNKMAVFLIGMALLVMLIGWWTAAEQEEASSKRELKLDKMAETLDLIKSSLPSPYSSVSDLSTISNAQLKSHLLNLTKSMRTFESGIKLESYNSLMVNTDANTEEQRHENWLKKVDAITQQSLKAQSEFRSRFLPEALALRDEMLKRLGILTPTPRDPDLIALDLGMLAGVTPISDAANYLENLARQLPQ